MSGLFQQGFGLEQVLRGENTTNNGISHFIEHMLFKGTKKELQKKLQKP